MSSRQEILEKIQDSIRGIMIEDAKRGANDFAYVRVYPDGSVVTGREASYTVPESEYFRREGHPVTVWGARGMRESAGFDDGVFAWNEVPAPSDITQEDIDQAFRYGDRSRPDLLLQDGKWYELTDDLVEDLDLAECMASIEETLDQYEWFPKQ